MFNLLQIAEAILLTGRFLMACCRSAPPRLPTFNLTCNIWFAYVGPMPPVGAPNLAAVPCQLGFPTGSTLGLAALVPMLLKLPPLTDIANQRGLFVFQDLVECPAGSGRYYQVFWVDDSGKGFANEHRVAFITHAQPWPVPTP